MDQGWPGVLREIGESRLHDRTLLTGDRPRDALSLLVSHSFERINFAAQSILECAGNGTLLTDGELHVQGWRGAGRLAILGDREHAKWQPVALLRLCGGFSRGNRLGLCGVLF